MPRKDKIYHFTYKTTCLKTDKFYFGMHSTNNLEDGYLGSGKRLRYSVLKYGSEFHKFEILTFYDSRSLLKEGEKLLINSDTLLDPLCMNLKEGGEGGWGTTASIMGGKAGGKIGGKLTGTLNFEKNVRSKESIAKIHQSHIDSGHYKRFAAIGQKAANSESAMLKRKQTFAERKHQQGENHSSFGTYWMTDGISIKRIKKEKIEEFISLGFRKGRK